MQINLLSAYTVIIAEMALDESTTILSKNY